MYHNYQSDLKKSLLENSSEYRLGYEQGIIDFAEKLKNYYGNLSGDTPAILAAYHIETIKNEMLDKENKNED